MKLMRLILILLMIFLCSNTVYADQIIAPIASVVLDTDTDSLEVTGYNISDEDCMRDVTHCVISANSRDGENYTLSTGFSGKIGAFVWSDYDGMIPYAPCVKN